MSESPNTVHGRLLEAFHIAGYTFERACSELDWLLTDDRWRQVGGGFADINAFLATVDLSEFRIAVGQRKSIARKLAQLEASQRATAKTLGVDEGTIRGDLGKRRAEFSAPKAIEAAREQASAEPPAEFSAPVAIGTSASTVPAWFQDDVDPARLAKGRSARRQRDREAEQNRLQQIAQPIDVDPDCDIRHGDFRQTLADLEAVDAIVTDPPYGRDYLPLLADLARFADRVLTEDGVLAVLFGQTHLPDAYRLLSGGRPYRWTACLLTPGSGYVSHVGRVQSGWKPVLVYGGGPRFADVVRSEGSDVAAKEHHRWGQDAAAFATLVERLTKPGQLVVDPFLGGGTTAVVCRQMGRRFVGCDIDAAAVETTRARLAA